MTGFEPVRTVLTAFEPVRTVLTGFESVRTVSTGFKPVRTVLTGFEPVRIDSNDFEPGTVNPDFPFCQPNRFNQASQTDSWTGLVLKIDWLVSSSIFSQKESSKETKPVWSNEWSLRRDLLEPSLIDRSTIIKHDEG